MFFAPLLKGLEFLGKGAFRGMQAAGRGAVNLGRRIGDGLNDLDGDGENPATLDQVRRHLPPTFSGSPNPATLPRPTNGAGNLSTALGIPDEGRRAGNLTGAAGIPDTGGGVLIGNGRPRYEPNGPGDLPTGRPVQVPLLRRPGEPIQAPEPPRTVGDPSFRAALREPEVAALDFRIDPNQPTVAAPLTRPNGKTQMSRLDNSAFRPADYSHDPVGRARRDAEIQANFDPKLQTFGGRFRRALKTGGLAGLTSIAQRYQADPRADWRELLGAGAGGFGAGTAIATKDPMAGAGMDFDLLRRPRMEAQIEKERKEEERQGVLRRRALDDEYRRAQIDHLKRPPEPKAPPRPAAPNWMWAKNRKTGQVQQVNRNAPDFNAADWEPYEKPAKESNADAYRDAASLYPDDEADAIAKDSTDARHEEILGKLPKWAQTALSDQNADPDDYTKAKALYDKEYDRILKQNQAYTRGVQKQKRYEAVKGKPRPAQTVNQPTRKLSDVRSKYGL